MIDPDILIARLKNAAGNLSYFNAAEGKSWADERLARAEALEDYKQAVIACELIGIDIAPIIKGYLV